MKKIAIFLCLITLGGCKQQHLIKAPDCTETKNVVWQNKQKNIQFYENCLAGITFDDDKNVDTITYDQIDALLYLSYIYLTDNEYKDIQKANKLLTFAKKAIWQDCDEYHGHYDNFCYFEYYQNDIPTYVNNLDDAVIIYQMTLPCVYIDMIMENEKSLGIINGWFGSSRDINIPTLCDTFDPYAVADIDDIQELKSYAFLKNWNPEPETDGTMQFGLDRMRYHDFIHMLTYPTKYFNSDNFADVYIDQHNPDTGTKTKFFAQQLEQRIHKYPDLTGVYNKMIDSIKKHYISFLNMDAQDATTYARMTASMIILQDIFIR